MGKLIAGESSALVFDGGSTTQAIPSEHSVVAAWVEADHGISGYNMSRFGGIARGGAPPALVRHREFMLDSASPRHATPDLNNFKDKVTLVDGSRLMLKGIGKGPPLEVLGYGPVNFGCFTAEVLYVPGLTVSILSVSELTQKLEYDVRFNGNGYAILEASCGKIVCQGNNDINGYYTLAAVVDTM